MIEERMINLEIRFSHLEDFVDKLNKVVTLQQQTIERLEKEVLDLKRNASSSVGVDGGRTLADDKPPHY